MRVPHGGRVNGGGSPGDTWARLIQTFKRVHGTPLNGLGLRPFTAERAAGSLPAPGEVVSVVGVVARSLSLSVARLHASPRALLSPAEGMRMPEPGRNISNRSSIGEVLAAWIVTLLAVAIGVLLLAFHEPDTDDRRVPRWYEPPVADAGEWADDLLVRRGADLMQRSGSSTARDTPSKHR